MNIVSMRMMKKYRTISGITMAVALAALIGGLSSVPARADDDDAGLCGHFGLGHVEFPSQVDDRNDLAAQVDDATDIGRHLRHGRDGNIADDLAHLQHLHAVGLALQGEREVFAGKAAVQRDVSFRFKECFGHG